MKSGQGKRSLHSRWNVISTFAEVIWPRRQTLTNGCDVKYVFMRCPCSRPNMRFNACLPARSQSSLHEHLDRKRATVQPTGRRGTSEIGLGCGRGRFLCAAVVTWFWEIESVPVLPSRSRASRANICSATKSTSTIAGAAGEASATPVRPIGNPSQSEAGGSLRFGFVTRASQGTTPSTWNRRPPVTWGKRGSLVRCLHGTHWADTAEIRFSAVRSPRFSVSGYCTKWRIQGSFQSSYLRSLTSKLQETQYLASIHSETFVKCICRTPVDNVIKCSKLTVKQFPIKEKSVTDLWMQGDAFSVGLFCQRAVGSAWRGHIGTSETYSRHEPADRPADRPQSHGSRAVGSGCPIHRNRLPQGPDHRRG